MNRSHFWSSAVIGIVANMPSAWAQQTQAPSRISLDAMSGETDIIVTAQRRAESLQNVPLAITVVSADQLAANSIRNAQDLQILVPGLRLSQGPQSTDTFLRGVGSQILSPGAEKPISIYVDDVYYASAAGQPTNLVNVSQIAVLKGPQGTLFGRNATGGLIQITTRTPTEDPQFEFQVGYGNYGAAEAKIYASTGIATDLAADISFRDYRQGAIGRNYYTGNEVGETDHNLSVRSKWVYDRGRTRATLIGDYFDVEGSPRVARIEKGTYRDYGYGYWDTANNIDEVSTGRGGGVSLRLEQGLGFADMVNTVAYRSNYYRNISGPAVLPANLIGADVTINERQFTEELQLRSSSNIPLQWTAGVFYFSNKARFNPAIVTLFGPPRIDQTTTAKQIAESLSGYGQLQWAFLTDTHLTLGGRYTYEKRDFDATVTTVTPLGSSTAGFANGVDFRRFTYRVALDHKIAGAVLLYGSVSSGFKSGGFNAAAPAQPAYRPETITAYAVGVKADAARGVRFNVEGYYYDYKNLQVNSNDPVSSLPGIYNAGNATIYGLDADLTARLSDRFSISGGGALLHTEIKDSPATFQIGTRSGQGARRIGNVDGNRAPFSADFVGNVTANYRIAMCGGQAQFTATYQYNSGYFALIDNAIRQPAFSTVNGSVRWSTANDVITITAWATNLTDAKAIQWANISPGDPRNSLHSVAYGAPRAYGAIVGFKF